jgi:hypothetical protein
MTAQDFFYYSLGLGVWISLAILVFMAFQVYRLFQHLKEAGNKAQNIIEDVSSLETAFKIRVLGILQSLLNKFTSRR